MAPGFIDLHERGIVRGFRQSVMEQAIGIAAGRVARGFGCDRRAHGINIFDARAQRRPAGDSDFHQLAYFKKLANRSLRGEARQVRPWQT